MHRPGSVCYVEGIHLQFLQDRGVLTSLIAFVNFGLGLHARLPINRGLDIRQSQSFDNRVPELSVTWEWPVRWMNPRIDTIPIFDTDTPELFAQHLAMDRAHGFGQPTTIEISLHHAASQANCARPKTGAG